MFREKHEFRISITKTENGSYKLPWPPIEWQGIKVP